MSGLTVAVTPCPELFRCGSAGPSGRRTPACGVQVLCFPAEVTVEPQ